MRAKQTAVMVLCREQNGVVTRDQLVATGLSDDEIHRLTKAQWLVGVQHCVYRLASVPDEFLASCHSAVLSAGPHALAARRSAAHLWGLRERNEIEVIVPRWERRHLRRGRVIESVDIRPIDRAVRHGVPVTAVPRTLIDCSGVNTVRGLGYLVDSAIQAGLTTYPVLLGAFHRLARRGRPGIGVMRQLLNERLDLGLSPTNTFERLALAAIASAGLPRPVPQYPVRVGGSNYFLDLAWPEWKVLVECDGFESHGTAEALRSDLERQNALMLDGWFVLRFAYGTVRDDPDQVTAQVADAINSRRA